MQDKKIVASGGIGWAVQLFQYTETKKEKKKNLGLKANFECVYTTVPSRVFSPFGWNDIWFGKGIPTFWNLKILCYTYEYTYYTYSADSMYGHKQRSLKLLYLFSSVENFQLIFKRKQKNIRRIKKKCLTHIAAVL